MSEYQYYEFLAVDRPLTNDERAELRKISTRAEITSSRFVNEYNYSDLRGDPHAILARYFDVFIYLANWGTNRLTMRFPADLLDIEQLRPYIANDGEYMEFGGPFVLIDSGYGCMLLDVWNDTDEPEEWLECTGWMDSLAGLRDDILGGDLRALYLAWLSGVQNEQIELDEIEPPVPPGLGELSDPLLSLAEFLRLDEYLLEAAAERSGPWREGGLTGLDEWVAALPGDEKDALLAQVVRGEDAHVSTRLLRRFRAEGEVANGDAAGAARTAAELGQCADALLAIHEAEEARHAEQERLQREKIALAERAIYLAKLAGQETRLWSEAEELIVSKRQKAYVQAVSTLVDLRDLASWSGEEEAFARRFASLYRRHRRKSTLIARIRNAGLT